MNLYKSTGVVFNTKDRRNATNSILNGVCIRTKFLAGKNLIGTSA